jgi:hypothetical protein
MNRNFFIMALLVCLPGCSPKFNVSSDVISPDKFGSYSSFMFFNPEKLPASNFSFGEEHKTFLFDAIAEEMKKRGYRSKSSADIVIKVQGGTQSTQEVRNDNRGGIYDPYPYSYRGIYGPYFPQEHQDISKKETTIIIDMLDAETNKLVWQGVGVGVLGKRKEDVIPKIREAISRIFEEFPFNSPL